MHTSDNGSSLNSAALALLSDIPEDFPVAQHCGIVPGISEKLLMTKWNRGIYTPGCAPQQRYERWRLCEDLAKHLLEKAIESKTGKRSSMAEIEILAQYLPRLLRTKWTSEAEAKWVIRRVAELLRWPCPPTAFD